MLVKRTEWPIVRLMLAWSQVPSDSGSLGAIASSSSTSSGTGISMCSPGQTVFEALARSMQTLRCFDGESADFAELPYL